MDFNDLHPENISPIFAQLVVRKLFGKWIDTKLEHPLNIFCILFTLMVLNVSVLYSTVVKEIQLKNNSSKFCNLLWSI